MPNLVDLILISEKARRGGGGRGRGPGSRGGKFFINSHGHVEYGARPSGGTHASGSGGVGGGQRAVRTGVGGGSGRAKVGELRPGYRVKPQSSAAKLASHKRMLREMDKAIKLGKDPHGNALSADSLNKLRFLATGLRTQLSMSATKEAGAGAEVEAQKTIKRPGSRGGKFYINRDGKIVYGSTQAPTERNKPSGAVGPGPVSGPGPGVSDAIWAQRALNKITLLLQTGKDQNGKILSTEQLDRLRLLQAKLKVGLPLKHKIGTSKSDIANQVAVKEQDAQPFTAFKDASGRYRWVIRSSSSYEDRDGETISQKALEDAVERLNASGNFGELDWWHTPRTIGTCDFSAMHGRVLIESGTFVNERVGERVAAAIASKSFKPGASLMFSHSEPGPPVLPGRVFNRIDIIKRALLDEDKASNAVTGGEIINLAANPGLVTKEVILKMDEKKEQRLKEILGPDAFEAFINGSETAEKALQVAGYSYKAMAPEAAPVVVAGTAPTVDASGSVTVVEAAPVEVAAGVPAAVEQEAAPATVEDDGVEPEILEFDTEALFTDLISRIKSEVIAALPAAIQEMQGQAQQAQGVATKEVTDLLAAQTLALKENTNALNAVVAENKSLKARLDALEGNQPAGVTARTRASQTNGIPANELPTAIKELVDPTQKEVDPYAKIIADLGLTMAPRG